MNLTRWLLAVVAVLSVLRMHGQMALEKPLPPSVDLNPTFERWRLSTKKQGERPTCSVFTTVAAMEYAIANKLKVSVRLSEEYLNWSANQVTHNTNSIGQFFYNLVKGYDKYGIATDVTMPYRPKFSPLYEPTDSAKSTARIVRGYGLRAHWIKENNGKVGLTPEHLLEVKRTVAKGWPVCAGSAHSVLISGYRDDPALPGGGEFLLRDPGSGNERTMSYEAAQKRICDLLWFDCEELRTKPSSGNP